ncbi:MAG: hypothetical protein ACXVRZ_01685 [Gaiellaceae bacterium]
MTTLVSAESLLLAVLTLFVIALLRSHAEILRRLEALDPADIVPRPETAAGARPAHDVAGATPSGGARQVAASSGDLLLAFLSSGCSSCARLIDSVPDGLAQLPLSTRLVVVTKSPEVERVRRFRPLEELVDVVMDSAAWENYAVPGSPYFVHVDGGVVVGEGSATAWTQVANLLADALAERRAPTENVQRVDAELEAAGIGPGHPSLHPTSGADG